ncbi:hypothetical protein [Streptomyces sp. NPDC095817]
MRQGHSRKAKELAAAIAKRTTTQRSRLDDLRPAQPVAPGGTTATKS